uniref:Uncharacterized protein n=1 Tax=Panagrolaimus davidi TaxID=227884 RepID=A0A914PUD2_9BILA
MVKEAISPMMKEAVASVATTVASSILMPSDVFLPEEENDSDERPRFKPRLVRGRRVFRIKKRQIESCLLVFFCS